MNAARWSVVCLGIGLVLAVRAGEKGDARARDDLLTQHVHIQEPGLHLKGKVVVKSLAPPHAELHLEEASGEGPRLAQWVSRWMQLPADVARAFPIRQLTLHQALMTYQGGQWSFTARQAVIPEGHADQLALVMTPDHHWQASVARLQMDPLPAWPGLPAIGSVAARQVSGEGDATSLNLQAESWHGGGLSLQSGRLTGRQEPGSEARWTVQAKQAEVDLAQTWSWLKEQPLTVGWRDMAPAGLLRLEDADFKGSYDWVGKRLRNLAGRGAFTVQDGQWTVGRERIVVPHGAGDLQGKGENLILNRLRLALQAGGGTAELRGRITWPPQWEGNQVDLQADGLAWAGWRLTGQAGWRTEAFTPLHVTLAGPAGQTALLEGRLGSWTVRKQKGLDLHLTRLEITWPEPGQDIPLVQGVPLLPWRLKARHASFNRDWILRDLEVSQPATFRLAANERWGLQLAGRWCDSSWQGQARVTRDGQVALQANGNLDTAWTACALPRTTWLQQVTGELAGSWQLATTGATLATWQQNSQVKAQWVLRDGGLFLAPETTGLQSWLEVLQPAGLAPEGQVAFQELTGSLERKARGPVRLRWRMDDVLTGAGQVETASEGLFLNLELSLWPDQATAQNAKVRSRIW